AVPAAVKHPASKYRPVIVGRYLPPPACSRAGFYHPPSATHLTAAPAYHQDDLLPFPPALQYAARCHAAAITVPVKSQEKQFRHQRPCKNGSNSDSVDDWQPSSPPR